MTMEPVLGIDLGTTNSVVAVADGTRVRVLGDAQGNRLIPSVVSFHPQGDVLVGDTARERRLIDAANTIYSIKRLIGRPFSSVEVVRARERFAFELTPGPNDGVAVRARGQSFTLPEISAFVLREVRQVAERALGEACSRAVITVPANFNELQRAATKAAGKVAGLEVMRILNEPTAAALAYGYGGGGGGSSRELLAVYDFGGGTFDVTILELSRGVFEVLGTAGDTFLGGDDIDSLVAEQMAEAFLAEHRVDPREDAQALERLTAAAEWSKCQLTTDPEVQLRVEELAYGRAGQALDLSFSLSRARLEAMARPLIDRTLAVCESALRTAGVTATQLDGVILVGGSTRMPLVRSMVQHYFGKEPRDSIDPDLVVAQGAALQGYALRETRGSVPPPTAVARVALRKASLADVKQVQKQAERRSAIVEEIVARRPNQPAFAPKPPPLPKAAPPLPRRAQPPEVPDPASAVVMLEPARIITSEPAPVPQALPMPLPPMEALLPVEPMAAAPVDASEIVGAGGAMPLLLDVTPHTLGVETVAGYCEVVIRRNAAIPVEQTRVFTTASDDQTAVFVRVVQGESRRIEENQPLGELLLEGLRAERRGQVQVEVTFVMDADGTLAVHARDAASGRTQSIHIRLVGEIPEEEIERMRQRQNEALGVGSA